MNRHLATAVLFSASLIPDSATSFRRTAFDELIDAPIIRPTTPALYRRPDFGHLRSAGKWSRPELATFSLDEGRLWGEWGGMVDCEQPQRIELPELDAEWMAFAPAANAGNARWLLARRDLQPADDGRCWSAQWYGSRLEPSVMNLLASAENPHRAGEGVMHVSYAQRGRNVQLTAWLQQRGHRQVKLELVGRSIADLLADRRSDVLDSLGTPLAKLTGLSLMA